jgi:bifunctional non-homologous end joining protein LigD
MEDHRLEYLNFEGIHESGTIMLWDVGVWQLHPESEDIGSCLSRGVLRFILDGEKLKGGGRSPVPRDISTIILFGI